jgi:hypothetical protein
MRFNKKLKFLLRVLPEKIRPYYCKNLSFLFKEKTQRNKIYNIMDKYFYYHLPFPLIKHRIFFSSDSRGFGEDAFHSMWYLFFFEFKPKNCLEIGVYRGQMITLWSLISKLLNQKTKIAALAPFESASDKNSKYLDDIDYLNDTKKNHELFNLEQPEYCIEYSTSRKAKEFVESKKWDLIFIDGNHDYEVVKSDFELSLNNLSKNGFIVLDDSSLYFDFTQKKYGGFTGHPGPSRVARDIAMKKMNFFGAIGHNNIFQMK